MEWKELFTEFATRYEWWQILTAFLGILYIFDKYFGISPVDRFLDREKKYTFKKFNHLHNPVLQQLIQIFNKKQFHEVENTLRNLDGSYRSFAFRSL